MPRAKLYTAHVGTKLPHALHAQLLTMAAAQHVTPSQWLRELVIERIGVEGQEEEKKRPRAGILGSYRREISLKLDIATATAITRRKTYASFNYYN